MEHYDIIIIGGGIIGCCIARELSRYELRLAVCEAACDVGAGSTKGNAGLVHSGYDPKPGTLKAKLNVAGNRLYTQWSAELGFGFSRPGSLVLGFSERDRAYIAALRDNAVANGLDRTRLVRGEDIAHLEPAASPEARHGFHCPHTGVVDPFQVAAAAMGNAMDNGAHLYTRAPVLAIDREAGRFLARTPRGVFSAACLINAAGLYADAVAALAGAAEYTISARHGDVLMLDKQCGRNPKLALYPVPTPRSKGVIVCPALAGNVLIGSTAVDGTRKDDLDSYRAGIAELLAGALRLAPGLNTAKVIRPFAGERAVADETGNDFYIRPAAEVPNFFHVAGIQSPGVASAPAIAGYVAEMLREAGVPLRPKASWRPCRAAPPDFSALERAEQARLIRENPAYGRIVCRCETVTEGEVVEAIRREPRAVTLDAVKRRTRAGMGRCQGGFCQAKVLRLLARELNLRPEDILLEEPGSEVVLGPVKEGRP